MNRRDTLLALLALGAASPVLEVRAQAPARRIAWLSAISAQVSAPSQKIFFARLAELGYREGQNLVVDRRLTEGDYTRLPEVAKELVALKPDLIVTITTPPTRAALNATRTIPIIFLVGDPLGEGIVESLARPGGNATGISANNVELQAKQLQMLKEVLPAAARVAMLHNPLNPAEQRHAAAMKASAPRLGLTLQLIEAESEAALAQAFKSIELARPDALYVAESTFTMTHSARIMAFANSRRLPVFGGTYIFAEAGGLMAYGFVSTEIWRLAADQVAKILGGAKPGDLPVHQASRFEMVINMKAAKALGIKIPPAVLVRADRLIE